MSKLHIGGGGGGGFYNHLLYLQFGRRRDVRFIHISRTQNSSREYDTV